MTTLRTFRHLLSRHIRLATRILVGLAIVHAEARAALLGGEW
jgi:hypothetical protein